MQLKQKAGFSTILLLFELLSDEMDRKPALFIAPKCFRTPNRPKISLVGYKLTGLNDYHVSRGNAAPSDFHTQLFPIYNTSLVSSLIF